MSKIQKHRLCNTAMLAMLSALAAGVAVQAAVKVDTSALREAVTLAGVRAHQEVLQNIATANGGTRHAGSTGYDQSAQYVYNTLLDAGYDATMQEFDFISFDILGASDLNQISPNPDVYSEGTDFDVMDQSEAGEVIGAVTVVDPDLGLGNASTAGCEAADFAGFTPGDIALIQRGSCTFQMKAENAAAAGAVGAIIFNQGNTEDRKGLINGTLSADYIGGIPVLEATYDLAVEWINTADLQLRMFANVSREIVTTSNVIAETAGGRDDRVVLVGAHLDSVPQGPGINDNGSGSAAILEIALQMAALGIEPRNKVRFAWWSAEESGLVGSQFYADNLDAREIKNIALNLNFDMIGSPNFVRFVYDGDGSATGAAGPNGSRNIEQVFLDYFAEQGLPNEPTAFDGRSDYGPFIAVGIPAGGLFTGAEEIKTPEQVGIYGGTAGDQFDPCYHLACDTYANNSDVALDEMSDATAHAVLSFAMTTSSVNGTDKGKGLGKWKDDMEYLGSHLRQ